MTTKPELFDVLATAVHLAALELAKVYPQKNASKEKSIKIWKAYLIQSALKAQEIMNPSQREAFRKKHLS